MTHQFLTTRCTPGAKSGAWRPTDRSNRSGDGRINAYLCDGWGWVGMRLRLHLTNVRRTRTKGRCETRIPRLLRYTTLRYASLRSVLRLDRLGRLKNKKKNKNQSQRKRLGWEWEWAGVYAMRTKYKSRLRLVYISPRLCGCGLGAREPRSSSSTRSLRT
jgi:hypothetical protein